MNQQATTEVIEEGDSDFFNEEESETEEEEEVYGGYTLINQPKKKNKIKSNKPKIQYKFIPQNIPQVQNNYINSSPNNTNYHQNLNLQTFHYQRKLSQ